MVWAYVIKISLPTLLIYRRGYLEQTKRAILTAVEKLCKQFFCDCEKMWKRRIYLSNKIVCSFVSFGV